VRYLIDGYNLLFHEGEEFCSLQKEREKLVQQLQAAFRSLHLQGTIVFDGSRRRDEESGRSYDNPLETVFAPRGQSADEYLLEQLDTVHNKKTITLVTNDKHLTRHARAVGAHTLTIRAFLSWVDKQFSTRKPTRRTPRESPQQMARLKQVFEDRLNNPEK